MHDVAGINERSLPPPATPETAETVSAVVPDWSRERPRGWWDPPRKLLKSIRDYQRHRDTPGVMSPLLRRWAVLRYRFWSVVTGADIPLNCRIGGGLLLVHPNGIVIAPDVEIGPNCLIFQQVTLGYGGKVPGVPKVGGHVDIGAGAKVLGGVTLGDHCKVGANAVVLCDVPPGATAVGVPARIVGPRTSS
ncbi:MAG: serine O-acetyltransferase [Tepidisphaerales bacterium]